jgi:hypothetical protein
MLLPRFSRRHPPLYLPAAESADACDRRMLSCIVNCWTAC